LPVASGILSLHLFSWFLQKLIAVLDRVQGCSDPI
jgi:hypothetical protein